MFDEQFAGDLCLRIIVVAAAIALAWIVRPAEAQNCRDMPPGPAKMQCRMQSHPEAFEKKKEDCFQLAEQRGSTDKGSKKNFMQGCLGGKVTP
jgi:hypothetical protein